MLNRIFVVASTTLTSTGSAVSSFLPFDTSCMKLPTQIVVKATGQGAYVRLSSDSTPATNKDVLVQGGDHVVMSVAGRRYISVLSDGASSTVSIGALSTGVSGNVGATLDLSLLTTLDPRITFSRTSNATLTDSNGRVSYAPHNLLTNSEDFEASAWTKTSATVTANSAVAPDGTTTADTVAATGANATVLQSYTANGMPYTFSVYLRRKTGTGTVEITADGTTYTAVAISATVTRFDVTATPAAGSRSAGIRVVTSGDEVFIWGAQLNVGALQSYNSTTPKNLLGFTQEFDNAAWTKTTATITANTAAGPEGYATADTVTATGANATVLQSYTAVVAPYTFSVYLQRKTGTGTVEITADGVTYSTVTLTPFLARYSITTTPAAGAKTAGIRIGTNGDEVYMAAAQLSNSASVDPYVYNPQAAPTSTAYYGPRFDYNPTTLAANGLLIEEQRTNLLTYSEDFSNAVWGTFNASITPNQTVAPNGTVTADTLSVTTADGAVIGTNAIPAGTYTLSIRAKANSASTVTLGANVAGNGRFATFTLTGDGTAGAVTQQGTGGTVSGGTSSIVPLGNGWYECRISNISVSGTNSFIIGVNSINSIYIWGAQLEAGSFATSYIPTVASQVTRAADNASMLGDNFATWYNPSQGTFYTNADSYAENAGLNAYNIMSVNDGTTSNYIRQYVYLNLTGISVFVGGVSQADIGVAAWVRNVPFKNASAYNTNSFNLAVNGTLGTPDTSGSVPTSVNRLTLGANNTAGGFLNGHIRSLGFYPPALPTATLVSLTT